MPCLNASHVHATAIGVMRVVIDGSCRSISYVTMVLVVMTSYSTPEVKILVIVRQVGGMQTKKDLNAYIICPYRPIVP